MTWAIPTWWQFVLLTLAAYRLTRLIGWDVISRPIRETLVGRYEEGSGKKARDSERGRKLGDYHRKLDEFIHCPFCMGFHVCWAIYLAWWLAPHVTLVAAAILASSAVVGLVTKNLDA